MEESIYHTERRRRCEWESSDDMGCCTTQNCTAVCVYCWKDFQKTHLLLRNVDNNDNNHENVSKYKGRTNKRDGSPKNEYSLIFTGSRPRAHAGCAVALILLLADIQV